MALEQALSNADQVEQLADQLSACADQIHARVMKAINSGSGRPGIERGVARSMLDDEMLLRQRADSLYAQAASCVVGALGQSQQHLIELTTAATEKIRKIALLGDTAGLVGGMLALAGAASSGQPAAILLAMENIRHEMQAVASHAPAAGAQGGGAA